MLLIGACSVAMPGHATECQPESGTSPCVDANSLWLASGSARFVSLPAAVALPRGRVGLTLAVQALFSPLRASVPSPDPNGREVKLVERVLEEELLLAFGLGRDLELGLALPVILHQTGAGSAGLTSQSAGPLDASAERDPHASLAYARELTTSLGIKPRLELTLPFGNRAAYASAGSVVLAPALPLEWQPGAFTLGFELAARLRPSVELGTLRWGSQGSVTLGLSLELLPHELLALSGELFLLPSLGEASSQRARAQAIETRLLPAEWLCSIRSRPAREEPWTVTLAAGAGLALSRSSSATGEDRFLAPTSPGLRLLAALRYAPSE